jgi:hypothetical protein
VVLARFTREALQRIDAAQAHVERGMSELCDRTHEPLGQLALAALLAPRPRRAAHHVQRHPAGEGHEDQHEQRHPDATELGETGGAGQATGRHEPRRGEADHERADADQHQQAQNHQQEVSEPPPPP